MEEAPEIRRAAWDLYVALHSLAAGHILGLVHSDGDRDEDPALGDIDDAFLQLNQHEPVLRRAESDLIQLIRDVLAHWNTRPASRLVEALPLLDRLAEMAGASLPLLLPPTAE